MAGPPKPVVSRARRRGRPESNSWLVRPARDRVAWYFRLVAPVVVSLVMDWFRNGGGGRPN